MALKVHLGKQVGSRIPQPQLARRFAPRASGLGRMLLMQLHIEREVTALAEQPQVSQLATLRLAAAEMGHGQDNHAPCFWVRLMIDDAAPRIGRTALAPVLGTGQEDRTNHRIPLGGILGPTPGHSVPFSPLGGLGSPARTPLPSTDVAVETMGARSAVLRIGAQCRAVTIGAHTWCRLVGI